MNLGRYLKLNKGEKKNMRMGWGFFKRGWRGMVKRELFSVFDPTARPRAGFDVCLT